MAMTALPPARSRPIIKAGWENEPRGFHGKWIADANHALEKLDPYESIRGAECHDAAMGSFVWSHRHGGRDVTIRTHGSHSWVEATHHGQRVIIDPVATSQGMGRMIKPVAEGTQPPYRVPTHDYTSLSEYVKDPYAVINIDPSEAGYMADELSGVQKTYDPLQPRDSHGKWTKEGGIGSITQYLEFVAHAARKMKKDDLKYNSNEELVLKEGRSYTPPSVTSLDGGIAYEGDDGGVPQSYRGRMGECFSNAANMVIGNGNKWTYVEGYAMPHGIPLPIHHAWVVDKEGHVLDPTWPDGGAEYFGLPFSEDELSRTLLARGYYGMLDNYQEGFPLLTGERKAS